MIFELKAQEALKQAGGRITEQRNLVIRLLGNSDHKIDAESLFLLAHQEDENISLATVYRTLNALADADVIQRRYLSPDHTRQYFERVADESSLHITCRECQASIPIETTLITKLRQELLTQYKWHDVTVCSCMSGLCEDCYKKSISDEGSR